MTKHYWLIRGFDSTVQIYEREVPVGCLSETQIKNLLRCLVSRSLSFDEIVSAYARRSSKIANNLLEIQKDGPNPIYMCGTNPHFIARAMKQHT